MTTLVDAADSGALSTLATWVERASPDDISATARQRLEDSIVDGVGCALYGSTLPWSVAVRAALRDPSQKSGHPVWGTAERLDAQGAAFANGVALHAFELDDFNELAAGVHGTCGILPAVVGAAQLGHPIDGQRLLLSAFVGWEVAVRVARALGPSFPLRGWHASAILATIGGAAATGKAMGLVGDQLRHAIGLGVLSASGLMVARAGGMGKRVYAGQAAANALLAARMAAAGITGPELVFEHPNGGFFPTFVPDGTCDLKLLAGEDRADAAEEIVLKRHASCGAIHPALDAIRALMDADPTLGPDTVDGIVVGMTEANVRYLGRPYRPQDETVAQFSVPYCLAAMLIEGEVTPRQFRADLLADPRITGLASRIRVVNDPEADRAGVHLRNSARIEVRLHDGSRKQVTSWRAHGAPRDPLSRDEVDAKFLTLARHAVPEGHAHRLLEALRGIGGRDSLQDVTPLLGV